MYVAGAQVPICWLQICANFRLSACSVIRQKICRTESVGVQDFSCFVVRYDRQGPDRNSLKRPWKMFIKKNYLCTKENTTEKCLINTVHVIYDTTRLPDIQSIGEQTVCLRCILQITVSKYCIDDLLYSKWLSTSGKIKGSRITVSPKTTKKKKFEKCIWITFPKSMHIEP